LICRYKPSAGLPQRQPWALRRNHFAVCRIFSTKKRKSWSFVSRRWRRDCRLV